MSRMAETPGRGRHRRRGDAGSGAAGWQVPVCCKTSEMRRPGLRITAGRALRSVPRQPSCYNRSARRSRPPVQRLSERSTRCTIRTRILVADALAGRITRRQTLSLGLRLGLASPVITALLAAMPEDARASSPQTAPARLPAAQEGSGALTVIILAGSRPRSPVRLRQPVLDVLPGHLRDAAPAQGEQHG